MLRSCAPFAQRTRGSLCKVRLKVHLLACPAAPIQWYQTCQRAALQRSQEAERRSLMAQTEESPGLETKRRCFSLRHTALDARPGFAAVLVGLAPFAGGRHLKVKSTFQQTSAWPDHFSMALLHLAASWLRHGLWMISCTRCNGATGATARDAPQCRRQWQNLSATEPKANDRRQTVVQAIYRVDSSPSFPLTDMMYNRCRQMAPHLADLQAASFPWL